MSLIAARERALEIAERLRAMGPIEINRFFGGAGLRKDGVQFGFVIEGALYLKTDDVSRPALQALGAKPFAYATRAKTVQVTSYYETPDEIMDDEDALRRWAEDALRAAKSARPAPRRKPGSRRA